MRNMDCKIVHQHLIDYQENNLQRGLKQDIEAHLSECGSCRRLLTGFQSVEAIIEKAKKTDPHPYISTRIVQHIENELSTYKRTRIPVLRPIMLTSTVISAIAIGILIGKVNSDRIGGNDENQDQIENLRTELFIHDFIDENKTLLVKE